MTNRRPPLAWWRRRAGLVSSAIAVAIVALATVLVFVDQFSPSLRFLDEWVYFGLGSDYWSTAIDNYKGSRLTWLFPLAVVKHLLPGVFGQVVLQWACLTLGGVSALLLLRRLVHPLLAVLIAVIAVVSPSLHAVGGADYHNTIALPLIATLMLAFAWAADSDGFRRWLVVGVVAALAVHANIMSALMAPYFILLLVLLWRSQHRALSWRLAGTALAGVVTGAVAATIAMGAVAFAAGQAFFFWWVGLKTAISASTALDAWYVGPFDLDYWSSAWPYLFAPMAASIGAVVYLAGVVAGRRLPASPRGAFIVSFLLLAGLWLFLQAIGILALIPDYFAIQLQYPALITLGCLMGSADLHPFVDSRPGGRAGLGRPTGLVLGVVGIVIGTALIVGLIWRYDWLASMPGLYGQTSKYVLIVVVGIAAGFVAWLPAGRVRAWTAVPVAALAALLVIALPPSVGPAGSSPDWLAGCWGSNARASEAVSQTRTAIVRWAGEPARSPTPVVIDEGQLLSVSADEVDRIIAASPTAFLNPDDPRAERCAQAGIVLRKVLAATLYTRPELSWLPTDGPAGLSDLLAERGLTREVLADGRPLILIAPTQRRLDGLVDLARSLVPAGAAVEEARIREGEWAIFAAAVNAAPAG